MTFAEVLKELAERIYSLWPARIIRQWEQGARLRFGRVQAQALTHSNGLFGTGLHFFWPIVGELVTTECNWDVLETSIQTMRLKDGTEVTFSLGVQYRVVDIVKWWLQIQDHDSTVAETFRGVAGEVARECSTLEEFMADAPSVERRQGRILTEVRRQMEPWGIEVRRARFINMTQAPAVRLITDSGARQELAQ